MSNKFDQALINLNIDPPKILDPSFIDYDKDKIFLELKKRKELDSFKPTPFPRKKVTFCTSEDQRIEDIGSEKKPIIIKYESNIFRDYVGPNIEYTKIEEIKNTSQEESFNQTIGSLKDLDYTKSFKYSTDLVFNNKDFNTSGSILENYTHVEKEIDFFDQHNFYKVQKDKVFSDTFLDNNILEYIFECYKKINPILFKLVGGLYYTTKVDLLLYNRVDKELYVWNKKNFDLRDHFKLLKLDLDPQINYTENKQDELWTLNDDLSYKSQITKLDSRFKYSTPMFYPESKSKKNTFKIFTPIPDYTIYGKYNNQLEYILDFDKKSSEEKLDNFKSRMISIKNYYTIKDKFIKSSFDQNNQKILNLIDSVIRSNLNSIIDLDPLSNINNIRIMIQPGLYLYRDFEDSNNYQNLNFKDMHLILKPNSKPIYLGQLFFGILEYGKIWILGQDQILYIDERLKSNQIRVNKITEIFLFLLNEIA